METKERIMPDKAVTLIDLDDIIRTRAGKKARYIPGFLINGLKRLIHQDFINEYLRQGYVGVDFCEHTLAYLDVKVKVDGLENISDLSRKYTFVSNHPLGAIDGVTLGMVLGRHYDGKIKYLVNDLLMNLKGLAPLCIPINKLGKQARNFPQMVENAFRSDDQVIMFPAYERRQHKGLGMEQDIYREKCGCPAGCGADTFHRAEFRPLLFHRGMVQTVASQV